MVALYYKGIKVNNFGIPVFLLQGNKNTRIKKDNRKRNYYNISFNSSFKSNQPKNLLVMYDISSSMKRERDWFCRHLVKFGYIMIQKSVWVGPSPLPKDFSDYVKGIKLDKCIKTFKLSKPYPTKK